MPDSLWTPTVAGKISLPHRLAMSPLTRSRATPEGVPTDLNAEYYAQRASHALIITEGTQPSADGQGYPTTPGIHTDEHIAGWRKVTDAVWVCHDSSVKGRVSPASLVTCSVRPLDSPTSAPRRWRSPRPATTSSSPSPWRLACSA